MCDEHAGALLCIAHMSTLVLSTPEVGLIYNHEGLARRQAEIHQKVGEAAESAAMIAAKVPRRHTT